MTTRKHELTPSSNIVDLKKIVMIDGKPSRICRGCGVVLLYKTLKGYEYSQKQNAMCGSCGLRHRHAQPLAVPDDLIRICPVCESKIQYKSKQSYRQAEKSSRRCRACADDATRTTTQALSWRSNRSDLYRELCDDPTTPVRSAYDKFQSSASSIGNKSKKEIDFVAKLHASGFERGKLGKWTCDAVNHETKTVVEHHGDFWHVRPGSFHERRIREEYGGINPRSKRTIEHIWAEDERKRRAIEALGYEYIVVWESEADEWLAFSPRAGRMRS